MKCPTFPASPALGGSRLSVLCSECPNPQLSPRRCSWGWGRRDKVKGCLAAPLCLPSLALSCSMAAQWACQAEPCRLSLTRCSLPSTPSRTSRTSLCRCPAASAVSAPLCSAHSPMLRPPPMLRPLPLCSVQQPSLVCNSCFAVSQQLPGWPEKVTVRAKPGVESRAEGLIPLHQPPLS